MTTTEKTTVLTATPAVASCLASFLYVCWTLANWGPAAALTGSLPPVLFLVGVGLGAGGAALFCRGKSRIKELANYRFSSARIWAQIQALATSVLIAALIAVITVAALIL
jgi:hypothetical protein